MRALILAGGRGVRLQPYTTVLPKPLLPLDDLPVLEIVLRQLRAAGVTDVTLAVGYLPQLFEALFQDGHRLGLRIRYAVEPEPLGTAGPVRASLDHLGEDFLVVNGDLLTKADFAALHADHLASGAAATIATCRRELAVDFGVVRAGPDGTLLGYDEKPALGLEVSMGINVLSARAVRAHVASGERLDMPDLLLRLRDRGERVVCRSLDAFWLDLGRVDDYRHAAELFRSRRAEFLPAEG